MSLVSPLMPATSFVSYKGSNIRYGIWGKINPSSAHNDQPLIVILPGLSEFIEKYAYTLKPLLDKNVDALILDWPSQGMSDRFLEKRPPVHIDNFDYYLQGLSAVLSHAGITNNRPIIFFGHSMGGHLALRATKELDHLNIRGILLSAPMMHLPLYPKWLVQTMLKIMMLLGFSRKSVSKKHGRPGNNRFYFDNPLTRDADGYALMPALWNEYPEAKTYEPTFGWVAAAFQSCLRTTASSSWLKTLNCPIQAHIPEDERVVDGKCQKRSVGQIPGCEMIIYPSARHELMLEIPKTRDVFWQNVIRFLVKMNAIPDNG